MRSVQMVYVGIAAIIIMLLLFVFNKLPEGSEVSGSTDSPADNEVSYAKLFEVTIILDWVHYLNFYTLQHKLVQVPSSLITV